MSVEAVFDGVDSTPPTAFEVAGGRALVATRRAPHRGDDEPNEDACAIVGDASRGVLVVADGVGGHAAGHEASRLTVRAVVDAARGALAAESNLRGAVLDALDAANGAVRELGVGAATTVVVVELVDGRARSYHVGDSACAIVGQRSRVRHWTVDHSPVGFAVEAGLIDGDTALHHDERHVVSNAVGSGDMRIDVGPPIDVALRDTVLLATDGVLDNLTRDEIVDIIRKGPLDAAAARLDALSAARMTGEVPAGTPSKPDDATFALWRRLPGFRNAPAS